jgi:hypothetical protein
MKFEHIREGKSYEVASTMKDLHNFKIGSFVTVEKIVNENKIECTGISRYTDGGTISQSLFPQHLLYPKSERNGSES